MSSKIFLQQFIRGRWYHPVFRFFTIFLLLSVLVILFLFVPIRQKTEFIVDTPMQIQGDKESIRYATWKLSDGDIHDNASLTMTINTNGLCLLPAHASAIVLSDTQGKKYEVSLRDYTKRCFRGEQHVNIPLSDFFRNSSVPDITSLEMQFWYPTTYFINVQQVALSREDNTVLAIVWAAVKKNNNKPEKIADDGLVSQVTSNPSQISWHQSRPRGGRSWSVQAVSSVKETKDRICNQRDMTFINAWIDTAKQLGVTHISVETPYDSPACGDAVEYTKRWVDAIHSKGLKVWHRHMPLAFEGIYDTPKDNSTNYLVQIETYIKDHPTFFRSGDIFTPTPQPQNGGIQGITYCSFNVCIFPSRTAFNFWLRSAMDVSDRAFREIKLSGKVKTGYYGFDGFVAWGDENPDWNGILDDETVKRMGNITIDHYPEIVGDTMMNDLNELEARYPNVPIVIGEWGTITGGDVEQQVLRSMGASVRPSVVGFNYWHLGIDGNEGLINEDLTKRPQFDEVQSFYR